jgi:FkbM family methyltransferase
MRSVLQKLIQEPRPFRFLLSRILWKTGLCTAFTIKEQQYKLKFFPSALSATLWVDSNYADNDKAILRQVLRPGDTYVDAGANIGDLTLFGANLVGPQGAVLAIEAHPRTFSYLEQNILLNPELAGRCHTLNYAVGANEGTLNFSNQRSDDQNRVTEKGIEVPVQKLDKLLRDVPAVRLLKIDVEGFEKFVIKGAQEVLNRTDYVYFEAYDQHARGYGYQMSDVATLLTAAGFEVPTFDSSTCVNVLASRRDRR